MLSPWTIILIICGYFGLLFIVSHITGKDSGNSAFFLAGRKSPWYLVAFGMIGASLSGVTFISIPGVVGAIGKTNYGFSYMQMVLGYLVGYAIIATILLPLYYKLNLTTIYGYLEKRFGFFSHKMGSAFFLLSRIVGASFRLYLVAIVLDLFVTGPILAKFGASEGFISSGIPFAITVFIAIVLIWVYTFRGGIKTIVWTDTLQTLCMLLAVGLTILMIGRALNMNASGMVTAIQQTEFSKWFHFRGGWSDPNNFFKQFIYGALIALVMTGLDQDMMQKNLTCRSLGDAQKNMFSFSLVLFVVNIFFLALGALLYIYASAEGIAIPERTDHLYPTIALQYLSPVVGVLFILGLIAAAYSSADSALTSLTTTFCVDFLGFKPEDSEDKTKASSQRYVRFGVHLGFSFLLFLTIIFFKNITNQAVISQIFVAAGYTYGPILGLFAFGIFTKFKIYDPLAILVCLLAPIISYIVNLLGANYLDFKFGNLIILLNGAITFVGLLAITRWNSESLNSPETEADILDN